MYGSPKRYYAVRINASWAADFRDDRDALHRDGSRVPQYSDPATGRSSLIVTDNGQ